MHGGGPIQLGLVASLNRPGGNVSGVTIITCPKHCKSNSKYFENCCRKRTHLRLLGPQAATRTEKYYIREVNAAARRFVFASMSRRSRAKVTSILLLREPCTKRRIGGIVFTGDPIFTNHQERLVALAMRHNIPAIYPYRDFTLIGGLMSYGPNVLETMRQVGEYAGRVLKGAKPSDLPVARATKIELVINRKTIRSLGLEVRCRCKCVADEIIE